MSSRRNFFRSVLGVGGGVAVLSTTAAAQHEHHQAGPEVRTSRSKTRESGDAPPQVPVQTPDIPDLPFSVDAGVKVFNLIAEPVKQAIAPNKTIDVWGFNGSCPGPTIQVNQ